MRPPAQRLVADMTGLTAIKVKQIADAEFEVAEAFANSLVRPCPVHLSSNLMACLVREAGWLRHEADNHYRLVRLGIVDEEAITPQITLCCDYVASDDIISCQYPVVFLMCPQVFGRIALFTRFATPRFAPLEVELIFGNLVTTFPSLRKPELAAVPGREHGDGRDGR